MPDCHDSRLCFGCHRVMGRRTFLKGCGAAAAAGLLAPSAVLAQQPGQSRPRVALVFLSSGDGGENESSWPYPGFDCAGRHAEILKLLAQGCPQVEFLPVVVTKPGDGQKAVDLKDQVDGYLVYTVALNWALTGLIPQIGKLGKPMVVADEYLGGSGVFLVGYSALRRQGIAAAAVSTTRLDDLVIVARQFAELKKPGLTPESFARQCEGVYRRTFAPAGPMDCLEDKVAVADIGECLKRLKQSRFLIVGAGRVGQQQDFLGAKGIYIGFEEFRTFYEKADPDEAAEWGRRWSREAEKVVEPTTEWITKAGAVYLAMLALMKKHGTDSITMNCLGGFASGQLPAYPCLGFMQILNDGGQGVCEAMPDDSVSTLMGRLLTGRGGYVSDPALDTSKNQIVYAHCMALTKVFGPAGPSNKFRIRTLHNRDPRGCCAQSFLPEGYMTTSFRTNVAQKKMVLHQAKAAGNLDADRGCRTQLLGQVRGDIGKLFSQWDLFGWHRVTVYGDIKEPLVEFGKALGLEIIEEA
ncbi:MAG: twin-arginine translocation signal domain-containing protein [Thermoguttaceae bacterium]